MSGRGSRLSFRWEGCVLTRLRDCGTDLAWVTAQTIWELRRTRFLGGRFLDALGLTVGMTSRALLTPVPELSPR